MYVKADEIQIKCVSELLVLFTTTLISLFRQRTFVQNSFTGGSWMKSSWNSVVFKVILCPLFTFKTHYTSES